MDRAIDLYIQKYGGTPKYMPGQSQDDWLHIMFCEIKIWNVTIDNDNEPDWWTIDNYFRITEVESISIQKSYKEIISKAQVKFPRGTVIAKRIKQKDGIVVGNKSDSKGETTINGAGGGEAVIVPGMSKYASGKYAGKGILTVNATRSDDGTIVVSNSNQHGLLEPSDIAVGNRIEIRLAYAYDEDEYLEYLNGNARGKLVFSGFISKCSVNTPLILDCEDMMSVLKKKGCPNNTAKQNYTVNDYLGENGTFHLLKNTGLKLDNYTSSVKIDVGKVNMTDNLVVADVLDEWSKCGLYAFMNEEEDYHTIRIGQVYTSGITYNANGDVSISKTKVNIIQFDWDVANDGLSVTNVDKHYLAVECSGMKEDGHFMKLTIRKTLNSDEASNDFDVINENYDITKRAGKVKKDKTASSKGSKLEKKPKISLDNYNKVSYVSRTIPITRDKLIEEGKSFFRAFNPNGLSGKLTLFGDRNIKPTDVVGLIDPRHPERDGWYFVSEVNINFSVSGGYRYELTIPYKLGNFAGSVNLTTV